MRDLGQPFTVVECEQRSDEWKAARAGRLTASVAHEMLAAPRKGAEESVQRRDLIIRLALERITGRSLDDGFTSRDMDRGIEQEPRALDAFMVRSDRLVQTCGFLAHNTLPIGASLDGYLGEFEEIVSFKCPKPAIHYGYLADGKLPKKYEPQYLHEMLMVPSAQVYHFVTFDGSFSGEVEPLQIFHVRLDRADAAIADYEAKMLAFLDEVDRKEAAIRTMAKGARCFEGAVA